MAAIKIIKSCKYKRHSKGNLIEADGYFLPFFLCYFYIFHLKTTPLPFAATSIHLPRPSILMAIVCLALNRENLQTGSSSATGSSHHAHHNRRESRHEERERSGKKKTQTESSPSVALFRHTADTCSSPSNPMNLFRTKFIHSLQ